MSALEPVDEEETTSTDLAPVGVDPAEDPYRVYLGRLASLESRRTMRGCLDRLARLALGAALTDTTITGAGFPWGSLRYQHTARLRTLVLEQDWSPAHSNKHVVALRQVLREAWRLGQLSAEEYQRATDLDPVRGEREPAGRMLAQAEIAALLDGCQDQAGPKAARDAALIAVGYSTGARRAELVAADLADWDSRDGLRLRGKGNKVRRVPLAPWVVPYLNAWLRHRGTRPGPLFTRCLKGGAVTGTRLTAQSVADVLQARTLEVGGRAFSPHDLRRTLISTMLDDPQTDLVTVQRLAGHASPATTARYDRRSARAAQAAVARLPDPHQAGEGAASADAPIYKE